MPICPGIDFSSSIPLVAITSKKIKNRIDKIPEMNVVIRKAGDTSNILVLFDDLSLVLHTNPLTIQFPRNGTDLVTVNDLLLYIQSTYLSLMKVPQLKWYHMPKDCHINGIVVNRQGKFAAVFST